MQSIREKVLEAKKFICEKATLEEIIENAQKASVKVNTLVSGIV